MQELRQVTALGKNDNYVETSSPLVAAVVNVEIARRGYIGTY